MKKRSRRISGARIMAGGFAAAILIGAFLLWLPVSSAPGEETSFLDALFTATTSICVTGLVTVPTFSHWSTFGHVIILILIQLGGLGVITCSMLAFILLGKKITIRNRRLIQESFNLEHMSGVVRMVRAIVLGTLTAEFIGAALYSLQFIPEFGVKQGIWMSVFHAVSAFCNAGIDILGPDSLHAYVGNPLINFTTMGLIMVSGIGFVVWWDIGRKIRDIWKKEIRWGQFWRRLQLHSQIAITTTAILIVGGTILIFLFEYGNTSTVGNMPVGQKLMASMFQSVTTRTAGFETIGQSDFTNSSSIISMVLMIIGGSPMGTAGGIKTTTIAILVLTAVSYFRGKEKTDVFNRQIVDNNMRTAIVVATTALTFLIVNTTLLCAWTEGSFMDIMYEVTSALGTVGLTRSLTPTLSVLGKLMIIFSMYIGRIGPITLASAVTIRSKEANSSIERPEKRILIG